MAYLSTALSVALRLFFPFWKAKYAQVSLLKPAPFRKLFAGLGSTKESAVSFLFSPYLTCVLSSPLCPILHLSFYLQLCARSGRNYLLFSPVLSGYNEPPDTHFFWGTMRLMSWPDKERYSCPLKSLVVTLLLFLDLLLSFLGLGVYCLIEIYLHTGSLDFHRETCAPSSRSLCSLSSLLQQTQSPVKILSL